jgi:hypothetical protein
MQMTTPRRATSHGAQAASRGGICAGIVIGAIAVAACGAGAVRPRFDPFPESLIDTLPAAPEAVLQAARDELRAAGVEIRWVRRREGYLETRWFAARDTSGVHDSQSGRTDRVRLRFWIDPTQDGQTVIVGEAVYRKLADPSLPERETESPVPPDHPAFVLLQRTTNALHDFFRGQTPTQ